MKITFHQLSVLMFHVQLMSHDFLLLTANAFVLMVWFRVEGFHFSIHIQADVLIHILTLCAVNQP